MPNPDSTAPKRSEKASTTHGESPTAYQENPDHVPDPFFQNGTVSTSDTAAHSNNNVATVSPVFEEGRINSLLVAERAIDPEDDTPAELVVLPEGLITVSNTAKTADEGREDVRRALSKTRPGRGAAE